MAGPSAHPSMPDERKWQNPSSLPGKLLYRSPKPIPTPPPIQPNVAASQAAGRPLAAEAASHMIQPHLPSWNCMAPTGLSSAQLIAMGGYFVSMALAILLSIPSFLSREDFHFRRHSEVSKSRIGLLLNPSRDFSQG